MNINNAFPSKYLKASELEGDTTYTVSHIEMETLGDGADADTKPIVYFNETEKGLVLNKTNANTITGLYGPETDAWVGKPVTLFATEVDFQGKQTLSIRVRMRAPVTRSKSAGPNEASVARRRAWEAFQKDHGGTKEAAADDFRARCTDYFDGRPSDEITAAEWDQFVADNYDKLPI
jgi:hypothetical protein